MNGRSVLVIGSETGPKAEIQPYTEGRSTFYARSETFKLASDAPRVSAPPKSPPHPIQESDDSLEQSRASIISQDVEQIQVSSVHGLVNQC